MDSYSIMQAHTKITSCILQATVCRFHRSYKYTFTVSGTCREVIMTVKCCKISYSQWQSTNQIEITSWWQLHTLVQLRKFLLVMDGSGVLLAAWWCLKIK